MKASGSSRASVRAVTLMPIVFTPLPEAVAGKPVRFSFGMRVRECGCGPVNNEPCRATCRVTVNG